MSSRWPSAVFTCSLFDFFLPLLLLLFFGVAAKPRQAARRQKPQQTEQRAQTAGEEVEVPSVHPPRPEAGAQRGADGLDVRPPPAAAAALPAAPDPKPAAAVRLPARPAACSQVRLL